MLISASVVTMAIGFLCILDSNIVWSLYEADARLFKGKILQKTPNWETNIMYQGAGLIVLGGIGVLVGLRTM
jgi:hypothetical protein